MSFRREVRTHHATKGGMDVCLLLIAAAVFASLTANLAVGAEDIDFDRDIRPILKSLSNSIS